jgi:hypothetical protein
MQEHNGHVSIREHTMYHAVRTETLKRWLAHAEAFDLKEIAAEIAAELAIRDRSEKA